METPERDILHTESNNGGGDGLPLAVAETAVALPPDWTNRLKLLDSEEDLEFTDGDGVQTYLFKEVLDPDENPTGLFKVFCKDEDYVDSDGEMFWITLNGLVSKRKYVAVLLDKFVKELVDTLPFSDTPAEIKHHPFILEWKRETTNEIDFFTDTDAQLVFGLVTGMDNLDITSMKSVTSINCINSYNGRRALRIGFITKVFAKVGDDVLTFNDYFTLANKQISISHTRKLDDIKAELGSVKEELKYTIEKLKAYNDPEKINDIISGITARFLKDAKRDFSSLSENLIGDFRNLFFVLTLASYCLDKHYNITRHVGLRAYVEKIISKVLS